jgi:hypothetical protein
MDSRNRLPPASSGRGGGGGDDDARKKRDSTQVVQEPKEHDNVGENPKKVRLDKSASFLSSSSAKTTTTTASKTLEATPALKTKAATSSSIRKLPPTTSTAATSKSDDSVVRKETTKDIPDSRATKTVKSDNLSRNKEDDGNNCTVDTSSNHSSEPEHASKLQQQQEIEPKQLPTEPQVLPCVLDIESALHCLVQVENGIHGSGGGCRRSTTSISLRHPASLTPTTVKEYLSKSTHVTFCVGHAGDASTIASFYRLSQQQQQQLHQEEGIEEESPEQLKSAISTRPSTSQPPRTSPSIGSASASAANGPATLTNGSKSEAKAAAPSHDAGSAATSCHPAHLDTVATSSSSTSATATTEGDESPGMLELWLADGMGDEDTPPSVFCLLAYLSSDDTDTTSPASQTTNPGPAAAAAPQTIKVSTLPPAIGTSSHHSPQQLGAVAFLTVAWTADDDKVGGGVSGEVGWYGVGGGADGGRMLRVEWFHVNHLLRLESPEVASVLERRMWLRLSILSRLTGCQLLLVNSWSGDNNVLTTTRVKQKSIGNGAGAPGIVPSAE